MDADGSYLGKYRRPHPQSAFAEKFYFPPQPTSAPATARPSSTPAAARRGHLLHRPTSPQGWRRGLERPPNECQACAPRPTPRASRLPRKRGQPPPPLATVTSVAHQPRRLRTDTGQPTLPAPRTSSTPRRSSRESSPSDTGARQHGRTTRLGQALAASPRPLGSSRDRRPRDSPVTAPDRHRPGPDRKHSSIAAVRTAVASSSPRPTSSTPTSDETPHRTPPARPHGPAERSHCERTIDASGKYVVPGGVDGQHATRELSLSQPTPPTPRDATRAAPGAGTVPPSRIRTRASPTPALHLTPAPPRPRGTATEPSTTP
ncbi:hypothetical protein [Streptomyces sp. DHE17-7]|uniref:hypothetical protein n=1 Tax=Streptomyces sp. DHE17-7 TaxID=2759949 RepID=UPI002FCE2004